MRLPRHRFSLLVERRRGLIKSLGFAQQDEQLEAHMDLIVRLQAVIEGRARRRRCAMIERRAYPRHKTLIKGRIYFNNRLSSMDCIVRDIGENGSRLEFSENVTLPDVFELYLPNKDEYFQAHVI